MKVNDEDWRFYKLMRIICEEYDKNWKTTPPIREVDRFMKRVLDIYQELEKLHKT